MTNDNKEKEQKVKEILLNSKRFVQYGFIKLGIKAMRNKDLLDMECLVYSQDENDKDRIKILDLIHKEMRKRNI